MKLVTNNLSKVYKSGSSNVFAVKDLSIEIPDSKLTVLKGPSGSGKTTLINLLGLLEMPTNGKIFYNDLKVNLMSEEQKDEIRRRDLGFVFQSIALMPHMTALENVEFGLRIAGYPKEERLKRAKECLEKVGISKRAVHIPAEMSGGEQQRVAIARAIAHRPKIIFADEPTAQMDTAISIGIVKIFKELIESEGVTIVMTTHSQEMIEIADNVLSLRGGELSNE